MGYVVLGRRLVSPEYWTNDGWTAADFSVRDEYSHAPYWVLLRESLASPLVERTIAEIGATVLRWSLHFGSIDHQLLRDWSRQGAIYLRMSKISLPSDYH